MNKKETIQIAIDGPGGSGKSTLAKLVSARLGFIYVDTGAIYRAIALYCLRHHLPVDEAQAVIAVLDSIQVNISYVETVQHMFLNGENVSEAIRTMAVSQAASMVAAIPQVRDKLLALQQTLAATHHVVMDGRDIGTVVLPQADLKIFLTASVLTRAKRRQAELAAKGEHVDLALLTQEIQQRDDRDRHRTIAPLVQAADAILIDTTEDSIDQVLEKIITLAKPYT